MTGLAIPDRSRRIVAAREASRCLRCGTPTMPGEWHHRRSRSVKDEHTHCPCNGALLCGACHRWAHANPFEARRTGFIVSRSGEEPFATLVRSWYGPLYLHCNGDIDFHIENGAFS